MFPCRKKQSSTVTTIWKLGLSPFSTRRLFSREATFSLVGVAYHISKCDADKGKSRFARKKSPSGKRALKGMSNTLYIKLFYWFIISCLVLKIFWLKAMRFPPSWMIFYLIHDGFGDVTSEISHIKVLLGDQIQIGRCFKGFEWFCYLKKCPEYNFDLIMVSGCQDKNIAWPCMWRNVHIYKNPRWRTSHCFQSKYFRNLERYVKSVKEFNI